MHNLLIQAMHIASVLGIVGAALLGLLSLAPIGTKADADALDVAAVITRRLALVSVIANVLMAVSIWAYLRAPDLQGAWVADQLRHGWSMVWVCCAGLAARITTLRYIAPGFSAWARSRRIAQEVDRHTDIRLEMDRLKPAEFDPEKLFCEGEITLGRREDGTPLRMPMKAFKSTHVQIIGATGRGKGVVLQTIYSQVVRAQFGAWYFDPKGDDYIPAILAFEAKKAGRPFIILDLVNKKGSYAPFSGGTVEERTERMNTAFMLERGGSDSDYYKNNERVLLRTTVEAVGNQKADLRTLLQTFKAHKLALFGKGSKHLDNPMTVEAMLSEWQSLATVSVKPSDGLDVAQAVRDRAVVYVRCALRGLTADVASVLLIELTDELIKAPPSARGEHIVVGLDEAATLMSQQVVTSLTAVRSTGTTMMLAYQASGQVRNMRDQRVDKDAAEGTVNINCESRIVYGTTMEETAEKISLSSGNKRVLTLLSESAETGAWGGERWSGKRSFREDEAALITTDTVKALPERVAVFQRPNALAELVWTCWMPKRDDQALKDSIRAWEEQSMATPQVEPVRTISLAVPPRPPKRKTPSGETSGSLDG